MGETGRITLRLADEADESFDFRLFVAGRPELAWIDGLDGEQRLRLLRQQFHCQRESLARTYHGMESNIVCLEGEPVGRLLIHRGEREFRILDVTLLPEYRSRGIGGTLLAGIAREAAGEGKPVSIQVAWYNRRARSLYERLGFTAVRDTGVYCEMCCAPSVAARE